MTTKRPWIRMMAISMLATAFWAQTAPAAGEAAEPQTAEAQQSPDNYLPNPGFEDGLSHWAPWVYGNKNGTASLDDKVAHSGKCSMRFDYKKDADPRLGTDLWMENYIKAILTPGKVCTMSGWIKIATVPPGKKGPAAFINVNPSGDGSPAVFGPTNPAKNNGWVFVSFHFKAKKEYGGYQFRCSCYCPDGVMCGQVWFDDLKVEEGEKPTAFRPDWVDETEFYSQEETIPWLPLPEDYRASTEVVTPHLEPAKPYAGGPLRVLWAGFYNNARMPCELAERGDFAMDSVVFNGSSIDRSGVHTLHQRCVDLFRRRLGTEPNLPAGRVEGLEPAQAPQALVIEQSSVDLLNKKDRAMILDRIRQGMGCVVLLGAPNANVTKPTPKIKEMLDAAVQMEDAGSGNVLTVPYPVSAPLWREGTFGVEETYSDVINAIYRSVGRIPLAVQVAPPPQKPQPGEPWKATVRVPFDREQSRTAQARPEDARTGGNGASVEAFVIPDVALHDYDGLTSGHGVTVSRDPVAQASADLAEGAPFATLALPPLGAGEYILEARLLDKDKRVLGWSLSKVVVSSGVSVTKLDSGAAAFEAANQPLNVACTIRNDGAPVENASVSAQIADPFGRLLARIAPVAVSLKHGETTCNLAASLSHSERCSADLRVEVKAGQKTLAQADTWLSAEKLMPRVDFNVGPYDDYSVGARNLGADIIVSPSRPDLGLRPYTWINLLGTIGEQSCICDPAVIEKAQKYVVENAVTNNAPLHMVGCILHDELDVYGFRSKLTEHDLAFFRDYLKETYKTLDALNASWGSAYKDWGEINAEPTKINFATQYDQNPAPWADWYAASEQAAYRFYGALDAAARQADPGARIGPSGTRDTTGTNGTDWWLLAKVLRSVSLYDGIHGEMYRSFAAPDSYMTRWSHLTDALDDPDGIRSRIWSDVFLGRGGTQTYGGRYSNIFFPDYRPKPGGTAFFEELAVIRNGYGRLLLGAKRDDADAAIFYSPASYRARIVQTRHDESYTAAGVQNGLVLSLSGALNDLHIASHFVSYEQVARGELKPGSPKALFLWGALALSDPEAAAIRKYVNDGGVVIADEEPGLYDEHCHKLPQGKLHDLFSGPAASVQGHPELGRMGGPLAPGRPEPGRMGGATGAVRDFGKGKTALFGAASLNYMSREGYGTGGEESKTVKAKEGAAFLAKLLDVLSRATRISPAFALTDEQGKELVQGVTSFSYVDGPARYVAVIVEGKYGETRKAKLAIRGDGQCYDCRSGKYLGQGGTHEVDLRLAVGNLFALLPYKVDGMQLIAPAAAALGAPIHVKAALQAAPGPLVRHAFVLQLRRPDKKELPVHRWVLDTMNPAVETDLFLALNDPAGKWTLIFSDAATGLRQEQPIEVQASAAAL